MPKKKNKDKDKEMAEDKPIETTKIAPSKKVDDISVSPVVKDNYGISSLEAGDQYSLNMKLRQFWAVPGFEVTAASPSAEIPPGLTPQSRQMIRAAIMAKILIKGWISIPYVTKNTDILQKYLDALDRASNSKRDLWPIICEISKSHKNDLGNYSNREVINAMILHEIARVTPRKAHLDLLHFAMNKMPGHSLVTDDIAEPKVQRDMAVELRNLHRTPPPHPNSPKSEI